MQWWNAQTKEPPTNPHEVLCGWLTSDGLSVVTYEVLLHWPDGTWTDTMENEKPEDEMPHIWCPIQPPHAHDLRTHLARA